MYVAEGTYNDIAIFRKNDPNSQRVGTLGFTSPVGLFVDRDNLLYAVDQVDYSVGVFRPGHTTPFFSYNRGLARPLFVIADSFLVFVGNANDGTITVFPKGQSVPIGRLKTPGAEVDGINFGPGNDIYAAYRKSNRAGAGGIVRFPRNGFGKGVDLGISLTAPLGIALDPLGDILVIETEGANRIDFFEAGKTHALRYAPTVGIPAGLQIGAGFDHVYAASTPYPHDGYVVTTPFPIFKPVQRWEDQLRGYLQGLALTPTAKP